MNRNPHCLSYICEPVVPTSLKHKQQPLSLQVDKTIKLNILLYGGLWTLPSTVRQESEKEKLGWRKLV